MADSLQCIHGIVWETCSLCASKSKAEVKKEIDSLHSKDDGQVVYEEASQSDAETEVDLDYDID
ncbi:MAG: hypothetical protein HRT90_01010 [Candidatus Margulisbacteria bacterium]|nr:hypothetical protein [Candidatus Margulisiibacteriota bacterium]